MPAMPQPPEYSRTTGFAADERDGVGGRTTVRADRVDAELDAIGASITGLCDNLELIQRDDGRLRDGVVEPHSIAAATAAMFGGSKFVPRGAWLTATVYSVNDLVEQGGVTYVCVIAHTAAAAFATDRAAGRWMLFPGQTTAAQLPFTPTGDISATNVQAAIEEVAAEARTTALPEIAYSYGAL